MAKVGNYCKAYPVAKLREFGGWRENVQNLSKERKLVEGHEVEVNRELTGDSYLYIQEDFTVTEGIFLDENVLFDSVTPEWKEFCEKELNFRSPS